MLKIFEAFSGAGAQRMALRNLNVDFKIVATSDIDLEAILAYYYIHHFNKKIKSNKTFSEKLEYLRKIGLDIKKINEDKTNKIFQACIVSNNLGDIKKIKSSNIPKHDIFTYSFPCQDISSIGKREGLLKDSGTRSSLLWECQKIIEEYKPKYLILENVKNLIQGKNKLVFNEWLTYLEKLGYSNFTKILDPQEYGIPHRRPRVFTVSKLGKARIDFFKSHSLKKKTILDILDNTENSYEIYLPKIPLKKIFDENKIFFLDDRDWKMNGIMIDEVSSTQRAGRNGLKCAFSKNKKIYARFLTTLECCRLMGYLDTDYKKMKLGGLSDTTIKKICGNSIVVDILESIFFNIYREENLI